MRLVDELKSSRSGQGGHGDYNLEGDVTNSGYW